MANTASAKKAIRSSRKKASFNRKVKSEVQTLVKDTRSLVVKKEKEKALTVLKKTVKALDKSVNKNIMPKNRVARLKSRLTKSVNNIK